MDSSPGSDTVKPERSSASTATSSSTSPTLQQTASAHRQSVRSPSHSLLAASAGMDLWQSAHAATTKSSVNRDSVSMPPPSSKPMAERKLSASLLNQPTRKSDDASRSTSGPTQDSEDRNPLSSTMPQNFTTATDRTNVLTSSMPNSPGAPVLSPSTSSSNVPNLSETPGSPVHASSSSGPLRSDLAVNVKAGSRSEDSSALPPRARRTNTTPRSVSTSRRLSVNSEQPGSSVTSEPKEIIGKIGVCALDVKARSRPSRQILTRLQGDGDFEVIVFGDKAILDEDVENWPICDFLISFFSEGFPLDKAIAYVKLRKPFVVNDLAMQKVLWDRRLCLKILDQMHVPTPKRIEVNRDAGPKVESAELAQQLYKMSGVRLTGPEDGTGGGEPLTQSVSMEDDGDTLNVDGRRLSKPFVEKPVSGEDHNVIVYFPKSQDGGGARRLFRKIGNKSSEWDPELIMPRCITEPDQSYIYEQFLKVENSEDVKAYTVGADYCHAETRKSPVVDGMVRRNTHGKELRYVTHLSPHESIMAAKVTRGFGQRICGFDLLRTTIGSYVIDVNGWSFVKDNEKYYDDCANILRSMFMAEKLRQEGFGEEPVPEGDPDQTPTRSGSGHTHMSALRTILKSPSMSKLAAHLPHGPRHRDSTTASPRTTSYTAPLSSPPSVERVRVLNMMGTSIDSAEPLPPPMVQEDPQADKSPVPQQEEPAEAPVPMPQSKHSWKLKGVVTVIRHADRTPKQKIKFTAHSQVFVDLLKGHHEEVLLKGEAALASVEAAVRVAIQNKLEDPEKLKNLHNALLRKMAQPGTKVQIKPMFRKKKPDDAPARSDSMRNLQPADASIPENAEVQHSNDSPREERKLSLTNGAEMKRVPTRSDSITGTTFSRYAAADDNLVLDKLQLVMKWGGEPTHSARYQSQDLGQNMRDDFKLLNRAVLDDVRIFTSSEKRVVTSAQIWAAAFLGRKDLPEDFITVRKDLLDDSNAAKDVMDKVKKKLKHLLREGNAVPDDFAWPKDVPEPYVVMQTVVELLRFHRKVMRYNWKRLTSTGAAASLAALTDSKDALVEPVDTFPASSIQGRWCTGEDAELFKERWEKLFSEFCDTDKADPSKISELYDAMKYDALHNKQFLEWVFKPDQIMLDEMAQEEQALHNGTQDSDKSNDAFQKPSRHDSILSTSGGTNSGHKFPFRRKSVLAHPPSTPPLMAYEQDASYFKLFNGSGDSNLKTDKRLGRLRELYRYAKILFDYIGPQEYGITDHEKLEIGLLTSLPLLREIVQDLEELQASGDSKSFVYFTKESHIYTLLNCIMEGGIHTKIKRSSIPELDYLSQICFELYEARDADTEEAAYSIRISISPGCHTLDPLDVSLDSKHVVGSAPRRSLTNHQNWKEVIAILKAKFNTVELPKSFLAINVSDKHEEEAQLRAMESNAEDNKPVSAIPDAQMDASPVNY